MVWKRILIGLSLAAILAGLVFGIRIDVPTRPKGEIEDLAGLRERDDLNVILIVVDTLRADRLSAYGYERPTSPVLADLAQSSVLFANAESGSSWTKSSMASLWTGLFTHRTGMLRFQHGLPAEALMPAELLSEAGFYTAGIYRNGWLAPNFGFAQGFALYMQPHPRKTPRDFARNSAPGVTKLRGTDEDVTLSALEFLSGNADRRFFLYLHYMDVHQYAYDELAAEQGFGSSLSDSYDSAIHWVDRNIGRVLGGLNELDLLQRTLLVIASDHGEGFTEHQLEGHAKTLYREVTGVPLILMLPFRLQEDLVVDATVRNIDIFPTIFDLLGLPPIPGADGVSLVPLIEAAGRGEAQPELGPSLTYIDQVWGQAEKEPSPLIGITDGTKRVLLKPEAPLRSLEIFDRADDPWEQHNLAGRAPEWAGPLRAELESRMQEPVPWDEPDEVELDELRRSQLQALGYVIH